MLLTGHSETGEVLARRGGASKEGGSSHPAPHGPAPGRREVVCFDCRTVNKASSKATSTQCANCGTFIDLRDVDIRERTTQRIRTRGNVVVHKKGALLGTAVHCGSLTIEGSVAGSIYAQETVTFRTDAKVLGEIRCRRLVVDRRVKVTGLQPIHLESMELQGELTGRVFASGTVHIARHGRMVGGLNTARLRLETGGALLGVVRVGGRVGDAPEDPA